MISYIMFTLSDSTFISMLMSGFQTRYYSNIITSDKDVEGVDCIHTFAQMELICYAPGMTYDAPGVCIKFEPSERLVDFFNANCNGVSCPSATQCLDEPPAPKCCCCPICLSHYVGDILQNVEFIVVFTASA
ncbi:hypothetical protein Avbf_00782 [Armadillidium vulgare]|nr:hypothetical protein Avbf_00782 [Armadillidium vulgare]